MYIPHVPPYRTLLPNLPYTILPSRLYPKSIPSYPLHIFNTPRFPSIYTLFHSTLSYASVPYPKLLHPPPPLLKLDRNDSWRKRLVLLGQIDLPSGDKADTTRRKWLMAEDLPTFRHKVVLVTRDFCPRPGAPDVSTFQHQDDLVPLNTPRSFGTKTFRHQNISTQDGWIRIRIRIVYWWNAETTIIHQDLWLGN